ncbi:helix-turn-helix domain-containing protein [Flagellimonas flava]|nr:AraC family transcriptional regulator [Allomuricauda flava]
MIKDYKRIDLFGHMLFEKATIIPPFRAPNPMQGEACFLHIREGSYTSFSQEDSLHITAKQSVLLKCGNYVGRMIADDHSGTYQAVAVHFHPDLLKKVYRNSLPGFLVHQKNKVPQFNMALVQASTAIDKYVDDILFYFENRHLAHEEILILKTKEIILLLLQTQNAPRILQILENLFTERTVDFKTTIESHLFSDISLQELAQLTHLSMSSFKRKFKDTYGLPPSQYFLTQRLKHSRELLTVSEASVGEIAFQCGFKTIHHFSKKFKAHFGIPPSQYRLSLRDK